MLDARHEAFSAEQFDLVGDLDRDSLLALDGENLVGAALRFLTEAGLVVDPNCDDRAV